MDGLIQSPSAAQEPDSSRRTIMVAIVAVVALAGIVAVLMRGKPRAVAGPPAYAGSLKVSDLKMSQAQNFVGANVTYLDGAITNSGNKIVSHVIVRVTFKDPYDQIAQVEEVPIKVLRTTGPYPDTADLSAAPLGPGQSKPFRLIFEHLSGQWNQAYPDLQIVEVVAN